ncbi:MAG TPA: sigma-54 dependent transcriptional regulator [Rhodanobacteraceae bacterium]|nr:sigma-54 dependent transcriptional regulator [Rhodanobacteraceae bacterium]
MNACTGNVLLVDDNDAFSSAVAEMARLSRCKITATDKLESARKLITEKTYDLLLIDLALPDGNGLDLVQDIDLASQGRVAIVTGNPSIESAVRAVKSPAFEYLIKPVSTEILTRLMDDAQRRAEARSSATVRQFGGMIGHSACMQVLFEKIRRVAALDVCVLVHGESGTGKELVARALHESSGRAGRFVAVNCGAIAPELLSSQLFGHERGSFTGAMQSHAGYFEQAQGGTLFLDEITEMPAALQVYLLRVIETRCLTRVGGSREIPVDVRLIAASNRDPQRAVASGALRSDLYFRLMEFPLAVPPLRERREDIPLLARHFLDRLNERYGTAKTFSAEALRVLCERPWLGNVRELRHAVQRHYIMAGAGGRVDAQPEPEPPLHPAPGADGAVRFTVGMTFDDVEREMLLKTLAHFNNNKRQAARALGITAKTIYNRLLRYRSQELIGDDLLADMQEEDERMAD